MQIFRRDRVIQSQITSDSNSANLTNRSDVAPLQHQYSVAISRDDCFQHMTLDLKKQR